MPSIKPVGGKIQLEVERLDEGLDTNAGPNQVDIHGSPDCLNVVFDSQGSVTTRNGSSQFNTQAIGSAPIDGLASYNGSMIAWAGGNMYRASGTTFVTIPSMQSQFASGANIAWTVYQQVLFYSDGTNGPYRYESDTNAYRMGIPIPSAPTSLSNVPTAPSQGPQAGDYNYRVSYVNTHVVEGQMGSASVTLTLTTTAVVNVTTLPVAATSQGVAQKFIYRSQTGPNGTFRFVGAATAAASVFTDTVGTATFNVAATGITDGTAPTPFTTIKLHKDRLFFDDSSDRTILRYTDYRNPYVSEAANFINMDKGDGAQITAIGVQDDLVTIFKKNAIWVLSLETPSLDTTWIWQKTPGNIGIVGPKALVEIQNAIFFLGQRNRKITGFHIISGLTLTDSQDTRLRSDLVSNRIRPDVLAFPMNNWSDAAIGTYNNSIYCAVAKASDTQNAHLYWLDMNRISQSGEIGSWSLWDGAASQVKQFLTHTDGNFYAGTSNATGIVLQLEKSAQYNDLGGSINSYWWSKQLGGEEAIESYIKDFRFLSIWYFLLGAWNMRVNYRVDTDTSDGSFYNVDLTNPASLYGSGTFGTSLYGGQAGNKELISPIGPLVGRKIQIRFSNNNTVDTAFKVHSLKVLMNLRRILKIGGSSSSPAETPLYHYGYPSGGIPEPNVKAQWLFEETSGNIVDVVSGITLTKSGNPTYGVTASGLFANIAPGIRLIGDNNGLASTYFVKNSATTELDIGTQDFVIEWLATNESPNAAGGDRTVIAADQSNVGLDILWNVNTLTIFIAVQPNTIQLDTPLASIVNDGQIHKFRVVGQRSANLSLYVDGVLKGSTSMAALVGQNITIPRIVIGETEPPGSGSEYKGTLYELRWTVGNITNNSGGPGGG